MMDTGRFSDAGGGAAAPDGERLADMAYDAIQARLAEIEQAQQRSAFLAEAGKVLASSLDYETTLRAVAALAVPRVADWCAVDILQDDGEVRPLAIAHADPARAELARALQRQLPAGPEAPHGPTRVARSGEPLLIPAITDDMLTGATHDPMVLAVLRELGLRSFMCVPLRVRERVLGAITFVTADSGRVYGPADLAFAQEFAYHAGLAMDNARLYTESVAAQAALRESEQRYRTLVDTSPDGILLSDGNADILLANRQAARMLGYADPAELVGANYVDLMAPEEHEAVRHSWSNLLATGAIRHVERMLLRRDGTRLAVEVAGAIIRGEHGEPGGYLGILRDITGRKQAESERQRLGRLATVGQLAAGIAHHFNNVLGVIIGNTQLLQNYPLLPEAARERLEIISRQSLFAADLVRQIMDFSRISLSRPQPLDLGRFLPDLVRLLGSTLGEGIRVRLDVRTDNGHTHGDPAQLQQIVLNLALNARDAMPQGGELALGLDRVTGGRAPLPGLPPGEYVVLTVADTGAGIAPEDLLHVFEPFFTTKEVGAGTGLGLAQVHGLVQQHGGAVDVASKPGQGTTFTIYLPAAAPPPPPIPVARPRRARTILLVEHETLLRGVTADMLRRLGYRVVKAPSAAKALARFRRGPDGIDLVLADVVMPGLGGMELCHALRELCPRVQVLLMSDHPVDAGPERLAMVGAAALLRKPLDLNALGEALDRALAK